MSVSFLKRPHAPDLAYIAEEGSRADLPTVLFLHGFRSDMDGTKARFIADRCARRGQAVLRFDCRAHGRSGGNFDDCTIGGWLEDTLDAVDRLTSGPVLIVGSSMGGWLGLLAARDRPARIAGLIGIAAAPDFTRDIPRRMDKGQKEQLERDGFFEAPNPYGAPYRFTRKLMEEGEAHCLLDRPLELLCPVRLLHGTADGEVAMDVPEKIMACLKGGDARCEYVEDGDHSLSRPEDLERLNALIRELSEK